jgi:hypothetical protein
MFIKISCLCVTNQADALAQKQMAESSGLVHN